jgi:hypothetical protein
VERGLRFFVLVGNVVGQLLGWFDGDIWSGRNRLVLGSRCGVWWQLGW